MKFLTPSFWSSAFYFMFYAALAGFSPFVALYYQQLGMSGGQIGLLLGIPPLVTLFASPFWTGIADAGQRHKLVLTVTILAVIVLAVIVPAVHTPLWLFPIIITFAFFVAPIISLADNATMAMLGERRDRYGKLRVWGTVGWAISAPLVGGVLQRYGLQWMFWLYAAGMLLALFAGRQLAMAKNPGGVPYWQGIRLVLTDRRWILFLCMVFVAGVGIATINGYLFVLMDGAGISKSWMGIALTISTISELPVMFFSNVLLRHLKPRGLLLLTLGVTGVRCLLYLFIGTPFGILAIQLVHGMTFPALVLAGVSYAAESAPPGLGATSQGLFGSMLMGFGAAAGSFLGGFLIEKLGVPGMYGVIGLGVLVSLVVFLVVEKITSPPAPSPGAKDAPGEGKNSQASCVDAKDASGEG